MAVFEQMDPEKREHSWALIGRVGMFMAVPFGIPILMAFYWMGGISQRVDDNDARLTKQIDVLGGLVTLGAQHTEQIRSEASEISRMRDQLDRLIEQSRPAPVHN
jgi:hypothetical protein